MRGGGEVPPWRSCYGAEGVKSWGMGNDCGSVKLNLRVTVGGEFGESSGGGERGRAESGPLSSLVGVKKSCN